MNTVTALVERNVHLYYLHDTPLAIAPAARQTSNPSANGSAQPAATQRKPS